MSATKKNGYLYFAGRVLLLLGFVYVLDLLVGNVLRYFYFKEEAGREYRATYAMEKTKADVLIFGASRAYRSYVPDIIEDSLKLSCYNTGMHGQSILYSYATLKVILKRYTPKVIILDLVPDELKISQDSYDRLAFLLPYYKEHKEIRPIINLKSPFEKYKLLSSIYPFNSELIVIAGGNLNFIKKGYVDMKGYKPETGVYNRPIETITPQPYPVDSVKISYYRSFIRECQQAGIKLFIVYAPTFVKYTETDYTVSVIKQIAKEENAWFADYTNHPYFISHPELFSDHVHLNGSGAETFTPMIMHEIKKELKKP